MSIFYALDDNNNKVYIQYAKTGQDKLKCFECGYRLIPKKGEDNATPLRTSLRRKLCI